MFPFNINNNNVDNSNYADVPTSEFSHRFVHFSYFFVFYRLFCIFIFVCVWVFMYVFLVGCVFV